MAGANNFNHFEIPKNADQNFKAKCIHWAVFISGNLKVTSNFVINDFFFIIFYPGPLEVDRNQAPQVIYLNEPCLPMNVNP